MPLSGTNGSAAVREALYAALRALDQATSALQQFEQTAGQFADSLAGGGTAGAAQGRSETSARTDGTATPADGSPAEDALPDGVAMVPLASLDSSDREITAIQHVYDLVPPASGLSSFEVIVKVGPDKRSSSVRAESGTVAFAREAATGGSVMMYEGVVAQKPTIVNRTTFGPNAFVAALETTRASCQGVDLLRVQLKGTTPVIVGSTYAGCSQAVDAQGKPA